MANNNIQYVLTFTDPLTPQFVVNPYTSNGRTAPTSSVLDVSATNSNTSLLFYGKGHPNYGERTEENFLNILESFSGGTSPLNPVSGQLWYQRFDVLQASGSWLVWRDSSGTWSSIAVAALSNAPVGTPSPGNQYQFNTNTNILYYGVVSDGHPLNGQWIQRVYSTTAGSVANGATTPLPQKQLKIWTGETTGRGWESVNDVLVGTDQPTAPEIGTLWYNTSSPGNFQLEIYDGSVFVPLLTTSTVLPIANGGTGQTTASAALNALLPSQVGNSGKFLTTDGANASWATVASGGGGGVTSVNVISGSAGISAVGGPITTSGTITVSLDVELQGITTLNTTGFVKRTGFGAYSASNLISSDITTGLGYTPVNKAGDTVTGNLSFDGVHQVNGLPLTPTGADPTAATSLSYVQSNDITAAGFSGTTLTLTRTAGNIVTTIDVGYTGNSPDYLSISGETLNKFPVLPATVDKALHGLDRSTKRRTKPKRFVSQGLANGGGTLSGGYYVYATPAYEVGSGKLNFFVDGVKWVAATQGYQRVLFNYSAFTSPPGFQSIGLNELASDTTSALLPATTYDFHIAVDGGSATNVTLNDPSIVTFGGLVALMNARFIALSIGATAVLEDDNAITVYSNTHGTGSSISITAGLSNDVFSNTNIAYINKIGTPSDGIAADPAQQSGASYGYEEIGVHGTVATTMRIITSNPDLPTTTNTLEWIVTGNNGNVYYDN